MFRPGVTLKRTVGRAQGVLRQRFPADEGAWDALCGSTASLPAADPVPVVRLRRIRGLIEGGHISCTRALAGHHFIESGHGIIIWDLVVAAFFGSLMGIRQGNKHPQESTRGIKGWYIARSSDVIRPHRWHPIPWPHAQEGCGRFCGSHAHGWCQLVGCATLPGLHPWLVGSPPFSGTAPHRGHVALRPAGGSTGWCLRAPSAAARVAVDHGTGGLGHLASSDAGRTHPAAVPPGARLGPLDQGRICTTLVVVGSGASATGGDGHSHDDGMAEMANSKLWVRLGGPTGHCPIWVLVGWSLPVPLQSQLACC